MLERMWRKRNPPTLLVGMEIGATTVENGIEFLKKKKIELPYDPEIPLLGIYPEKKFYLENIHPPQCSQQHYLQKLRHKSNR